MSAIFSFNITFIFDIDSVSSSFTLLILSAMVDFYMLPGSAPCRAVLLTATALGVKINEKLLDLTNGEHLTPEFLKVCLIS